MALSYTEILVEDEIFHVFTLPDRRPTAGSSQPVKWLYQMIVESYLYHDGDAEARGTGAFYRLLQRTPSAAGRALCLRRASVGQGLITVEGQAAEAAARGGVDPPAVGAGDRVHQLDEARLNQPQSVGAEWGGSLSVE